MAALTAGRGTPARDGNDFSDPVKAATTIHQGALVCLDAAGWAVPGSTSATLIVRGVAKAKVVNDGVNGAVAIETTRLHAYRFANSAAVDLIARTEINKDVYIVDDQTVAKTSGGATRSIAGRCVDVDAQGVWVKFA